MVVKEKTDCCKRNCLGSNRGYNFEFYTADMQKLLMVMKRDCVFNCCCCCWVCDNIQRLYICGPNDLEPLMEFKQGNCICTPEFDGKSMDGGQDFEMKKSCTCDIFMLDTKFKVIIKI